MKRKDCFTFALLYFQRFVNYCHERKFLHGWHVILQFTKITTMKISVSSLIYYHTSYQDPKVSVTNVVPNSQVCMPAMLILLGN
jgi:hypothetical protein